MDGTLKVSDFDMSKTMLDDFATMSIKAKSTVFNAPELFKGERFTRKASNSC